MPSNTKDIKRRIKSISSTLQVTKALEMISSVKMRKSSQLTLQSREFSDGVWRLITQLRQGTDDKLPALFSPHADTGRSLVVVIASDKGLAGSYNSNVLRTTAKYIKENNINVDIIAVGKKANKILNYTSSVNIVSSYDIDSEGYDFFEASPISKTILDAFLKGQYRSVVVAYTDFVNTLKQVAVVRTILPIGTEDSVENSDSRFHGNDTRNKDAMNTDIDGASEEKGSLRDGRDDTKDSVEYKFEPDKMSILETLGRLAVRSQIYQALLEASASEHAARMVAMKNATESGNELVDDLQFSFNKLRQQSITQEIAEISAGRIALAQ